MNANVQVLDVINIKGLPWERHGVDFIFNSVAELLSCMRAKIDQIVHIIYESVFVGETGERKSLT